MTDEEKAVVALLASAWNAFLALPIEHLADEGEFLSAIHRAQDIVLSRPARRDLAAEASRS